MLITLKHDEKVADAVSEAISHSVGNAVTCTKLQDITKIEIQDADEEATDDEVIHAVRMTADQAVSMQIFRKRNTGRGTLIISVSVPTKIATKLIKSRLRIGYVNCRVRLKIEPQKCFKCQSYEHTREKCTGEDRSDLCWRCGAEGLKSKECSNRLNCFLCKGETSAEHMLETFRCSAFKHALEEKKTTI